MVFNHPNGKNGQNTSGSKSPEQRQPKTYASEADLSDPDFYEITEADGGENGSRSYC